MSFMFNPFPYDDPTAINRPKLSNETINSIVSGTKESAVHISNILIEKIKTDSGNQIVALDGYISAQWGQAINLISQNLKQESINVTVINFAEYFKPASQLDSELSFYLEENKEKDPVLLFGKLFKGGYEDLLDRKRLGRLAKELKESKSFSGSEVIIIFGCGCTIQSLRSLYDLICYFDVTPKEVMLRARRGFFANLGDEVAKPVKAILRRCYYIDFEVAGHLRWDLIKNEEIDYYVVSTNFDHLQLIPRESLNTIMSALVKYPIRCRPVYLEGVWGGHYISRLRNLPHTMRNCAWVFDLIPLEVSIVVEAGKQLLEFPFLHFCTKGRRGTNGAGLCKKIRWLFPYPL